MISLTRISASLLPLLAVLPVPLGALMKIGEGEVNLLVSTSLTWDSRINARSNAEEDTIAAADIALAYNRPSRVMNISATLGIRAERYFDFSEYDDENVYLDLSISPSGEIRTSRFMFTGSLNFDSRTESDADVGEIVNVRTYGASGSVVYDPNSRFTLTTSAGYSYEDAESSFADRETWSLGTELAIPYSRAIQLVGGVDYRYEIADNPVGLELESDTTTLFIGLLGQITPKIEGQIRLGSETRSERDSSSTTVPYLSASLDWRVDDSTQVSLSASNTTNNTLAGTASESLDFDLSASRQMSSRMRASIGIGYGKTDYDLFGNLIRRKDEIYRGNFSLSYDIARWGSLVIAATYEERSSRIGTFSYDRTTISARLSTSW